MDPSANYMEDFHAGVTACLRSWSAFRTAVESGWGGGDKQSQAKADDLRKSIFEIMNGKQCPISNFDRQDLADNLAIYLEEEFSVTLEDESEVQVAEAIFQMYEGCCRGDPSLARQLVHQAQGVVDFNAQFPVQLQTTEHDMDEDDDDDMGAETAAQANPAAAPLGGIPENYSSAPLFGEAKKVAAPTGPVRQLGEAAAPTVEEEMDDDGFAPVVKKKNQRKR
eukprot:Nitzschia sp. Nitz4//scaffold22_size323478//289621//290355//NITZ4_000586-RA/size323478-augustus-gene-0.251-mRNA-1//-1//CDS//3329543174//40//frame0